MHAAVLSDRFECIARMSNEGAVAFEACRIFATRRTTSKTDNATYLSIAFVVELQESVDGAKASILDIAADETSVLVEHVLDVLAHHVLAKVADIQLRSAHARFVLVCV